MKLKLNDKVTDSNMTYVVTGWLDNTEAPDDTVRIERDKVVIYESNKPIK
jgi:hypothetical protein